MTYQTSKPVEELRLSSSARSWGEIVRWIQQGDGTYDLPYQRGAVWSYEQRIMLIYSILSGTPLPALIINLRPEKAWFGPKGERLPIYAVIDGKQRITTVRMFMEGKLPVPASWFAPEDVETTVETEDGPYVTYNGLARRFMLGFERNATPLTEGRLPTVQAEAQVYLRVNGAGTPQADEDIERATRVAEGS